MMQPQKYHREIPQRYRLEAGKCKKCGKVFMPPRLICDSCKSEAFEKIRLPDTGKIHTYTVIRVAPSGFTEQVPYVLAVVELGDTKLTMQITDCDPEAVRIGAGVRVEFRKINEVGKTGVLCYGYKGVLV
ncbi:MAG: Zn-ribbon domain-containing OB-fold protein [Elusimicrobia bacterium]|nr:Zn-ribbon domain-containing OB-fold protein [Elusimicrobiota bacterium]